MKSSFLALVFLIGGLAGGYYLAGSPDSAPTAALERVKQQALQSVSGRVTYNVRNQLLIENPALALRIAKGGSFGGSQHSPTAAQHMYSRNNQEAIDDVRQKTEAQAVAPRTWRIRMPLVNAVLFDIHEGLVLLDAGMAVAGPALHEAIRSVSDKPLHTIIYTHFHMDHAGGTWALMEKDQPMPQVVATDELLRFFDENVRIRGNMAKYHSQQLDEWPASRDDYVWPTRTFTGELTLTIGGEDFCLAPASRRN